MHHIDGLEQYCGNSIALAMDLPQFCSGPSIYPTDVLTNKFKIMRSKSQRRLSLYISYKSIYLKNRINFVFDK